jgi:hypothetical protein
MGKGIRMRMGVIGMDLESSQVSVGSNTHDIPSVVRVLG